MDNEKLKEIETLTKAIWTEDSLMESYKLFLTLNLGLTFEEYKAIVLS